MTQIGDQSDIWALGLMSGTSLDGIDAALVRTDGVRVLETGPHLTHAYDEAFRNRLRGVLGRTDADADDIKALSRDLTARHVEAVRALLEQAHMAAADISIIGFHGHTIAHRPQDGITVQIGDGAGLAAQSGIPVVDDFRSNDVAHGGEGAPLASLYHAALAGEGAGSEGEGVNLPVAVLNLGGVGNVTYIGDPADGTYKGDPADGKYKGDPADGIKNADPADGEIFAFDTGPGNALIDDWVAKTIERPMDEGGRLARAGTIDDAVLAALMDHDYFDRPPPKSLDREDFSGDPVAGLSPADGAATLSAFTVEAVARGADLLPRRPVRWLVTGGGRHNGTLMALLGERLGVPVDPVEAVGWNGDAMEGQAFGFLAVRSLRGLPLSVPGTTGVEAPITGGQLHQP